MLVNAVAELKTKGENYNLVFVGNGLEGENLKARVKGLGLTDEVWFYGVCYDEKTNAELIYNADLCVAPGTVGLTAMHTMVFGTPVISHNDFKWQMLNLRLSSQELLATVLKETAYNLWRVQLASGLRKRKISEVRYVKRVIRR